MDEAGVSHGAKQREAAPRSAKFGSTFASEHSVTELFGHLKIRDKRRP